MTSMLFAGRGAQNPAAGLRGKNWAHSAPSIKLFLLKEMAMKIQVCLGCGAESRPGWDRSPKHPRARKAWEKERCEEATVCPRCNGGRKEGGIVVVEEAGQPAAYYFRLKPGCGETPERRFDRHTHEIERLPENLSALYGKLYATRGWSFAQRCEKLGHETDAGGEVTYRDAALAGYDQKCRHCGAPRFAEYGGGLRETRDEISVSAISHKQLW